MSRDHSAGVRGMGDWGAVPSGGTAGMDPEPGGDKVAICVTIFAGSSVGISAGSEASPGWSMGGPVAEGGGIMGVTGMEDMVTCN